MTELLTTHIVQSPEWGEFKTSFGTKALKIGDVQATTHKVPYTNYYYAYIPKLGLAELKALDFDLLLKTANQAKCFVVNFDCPNILTMTTEAAEAGQIFETHTAILAKKNTFTKFNILLDLKRSESELLQNMYPKHRYNLRRAQKYGVSIRQETTPEGLDVFYDLHTKTAKAQTFLTHPKPYYAKLLQTLGTKKMFYIFNAYLGTKPIASWTAFVYKNTLYYPYGGSSHDADNKFHASTLLCWELIKFGKQQGCELFDMWGACKDPTNTSDPEWGFTNFKLRFGGRHVEYMASYDLVLNQSIYQGFSFLYPKVLTFLKKLR